MVSPLSVRLAPLLSIAAWKLKLLAIVWVFDYFYSGRLMRVPFPDHYRASFLRLAVCYKALIPELLDVAFFQSELAHCILLRLLDGIASCLIYEFTSAFWYSSVAQDIYNVKSSISITEEN